MTLVVGDKAPEFQVQPIFGLPLKIPAELAMGPLVVCFVRPLGSPLARQTLSELQEAFPQLDRVGARLLAVTDAPLLMARDFVPRHHLLFPVVVGASGALGQAFGVEPIPGMRSRVAGPAGVRRALRSLQHGGWPSGPGVLPASFVLGRQGTLLHVRYGRTIYEPPAVSEFLKCVSLH
ncbi:MAG: redoxin domain-containing protein [Myxococcota bacterium]|jgi:peroxiredoxin|nr:redoxin domain-containing protein [Myxococcota bacterium]